jgi:hypothetical protein
MATDDELRALAKTIWDCSADRTDVEDILLRALATTEDAERQRTERSAHVKAQIDRIHSFMPDAEERN